MNRDRMADRFRHVKPNFYLILENSIILLWARKTPSKEVYLISAILSPLGPYKFKTHKPTEHAGTYLFRRLNKRIYKDDIIPFSDTFWNPEYDAISYKKFKEIYPYIKFNDII